MTAKALARSAKPVARDSGDNGFWIDHAVLSEDDYAWLASVERLTLWNVKTPPRFFARLKKLWWLDVRGGSGTDLWFAKDTSGLRYLAVNQVRGMHDLSVLCELKSLRYLKLYGLPQVEQFPSLGTLSELEHATIGQMRGLVSFAGLLDAPHLRSLQLVRKVNVNELDVCRIIKHDEIEQFGWYPEDVPARVWVPVVEKIGLPPVPLHYPEDWFGLNSSSKSE